MSEQEFYYLIFDGGIETAARIVREGETVKLRCDLPHLNPDAIMYVMSDSDLRDSNSVMSSMRVDRIEQEQSKMNLPLRIHVLLHKALKNDPNPLPQVGTEFYLMPEKTSNKIKVLCLDQDTVRQSITAAYYLDHLRKGCEAWIRDESGNQSRIKIEEIELISENSGVNLSYCDLQIAAVPKVETPAAQEKADLPKEEPISEKKETATPEKKEQIAKQEEIKNPPMKPIVSVGPKTKTAMLMTLGSLATAVLMLLFMPFGNMENPRTPEAAATTIQSSLAASEEDPTQPTSVTTWDDVERKTIPMSPKVLHAFFGQSDPARLTGRLIGEVEPGRLGIYCDKTPEYDKETRTSDASECSIALPDNAKPGTYPLTAENSLNWFHQADPGCFRESLTPYPIADTGDGLRINLDACTWVFDPVRKCFDYSKCTFTVPRFGE